MTKTYQGSCHCGAIRFEADVDLAEGIRKCNCSFCWKLGYRKALVPYAAVRILAGREAMKDYQPSPLHWPPGDINHYFCGACGAHVLSRGYLEKEMGGNFWAVNVACLDDVTEEELAAAPVTYEDGKRDRQDRPPAITSYL
ncbi:MAG TPA: GFA family protein [Aggregicoccus sp.]|nr:GFA family protein [Aggregicoccus sp.]